MLPTDWTWLLQNPHQRIANLVQATSKRSKFFLDLVAVDGFLDGNLLRKKSPTKRSTISLKPGAPALIIHVLISMPSLHHITPIRSKQFPKFRVRAPPWSSNFHPWPAHGGVFHNSESDLRMENHVSCCLLVVSPFYPGTKKQYFNHAFGGYVYRYITQLGPYFMNFLFE